MFCLIFCPGPRFGLEISDISDLAAKTEFGVFTSALEKKSPMGSGVVKAFRVPGGAEKLTRKMTDGYSEWIKLFGAGGVPTTAVGLCHHGGLNIPAYGSQYGGLNT